MNFRSDINDEELLLAIKRGESYRKLSRQYKCSPNTIKTRVEKERIRERQSINEIVKILSGVDTDTEDEYEVFVDSVYDGDKNPPVCDDVNDDEIFVDYSEENARKKEKMLEDEFLEIFNKYENLLDDDDCISDDDIFS